MTSTLVDRVIADDPRAVARAISLVEDESAAATDLLRALFPHTGRAYIVGVNCMRDPERTYPVIEAMRRAGEGHLAAQPVAFRCSDEVPFFSGTRAFPDRLEPTQLTRHEMAEYATRAKEEATRAEKEAKRSSRFVTTAEGSSTGMRRAHGWTATWVSGFSERSQ